MVIENAARDRISNAARYGVEHHTGARRFLRIAAGMLRDNGMRATALHLRISAMLRLHRWLFDARIEARMPKALAGRTDLKGMNLRAGSDKEKRAALHCSAVSSKTFHWALAALGIEYKKYHFVDIGSGWGYALLLAAQYPFRRVTGVEFARELYQNACANIDWAHGKGLFKAPLVETRFESALESEIPDGPVLFFLFNPFGEAVMKDFVTRIERSVRQQPRPIVLVYVNPAEHRCFVRPDVMPLPLKGLAAVLLRWFSPFKVNAYCWGPLLQPKEEEF